MLVIDLTCGILTGQVVRYGPNKLLFNTARGLQDIYAKNNDIRKSIVYAKASTQEGYTNTATTIDKGVATIKRKLLAPSFGDGALREYDGGILKHTEIFLSQMVDEGGHEGSAGRDQGWGSVKNMADWCGYHVSLSISAHKAVMTLPENEVKRLTSSQSIS
jgi:hypothetical protein